jgi:hypothetical protein
MYDSQTKKISFENSEFLIFFATITQLTYTIVQFSCIVLYNHTTTIQSYNTIIQL